MPVPGYEAFMLPLLRALNDGSDHQVRDVREQLATEFKLTLADRGEMLPSGKQSVFDNRVGWAKTYLDKAGLLTSVRRDVYRITDAGRSIIAEKPAFVDKDYLKRFEPFRTFLALQHEEGVEPGVVLSSPTDAAAATPEEQLESAHRKMSQRIESEVLDAVLKGSPEFFEKLVVELLVKMGYGGSQADAGRALGKSGDGGVDGMIREDRLGFDAIYVQAKRWADNAVQRPDVQSFAGSLLAQKARKGVFITTSRFSSGAQDYVREIEANAKVILIDGPTLARLMVEHDLGVTTEQTLAVKRLDSDYFSEE